MKKILSRDTQKKIIGGVAAGLAEYLGTDISLVRAIFLILIFMGHFGLPSSVFVYGILWAILPASKNLNATGSSVSNSSTDSSFSSSSPFSSSGAMPQGSPDPFEANYKVGSAVPDLNIEDTQNSTTQSTFSSTSPGSYSKPVNSPDKADRNKVVGVILVVFGILFFADQYIDFDFSFIDKYWPLGLVVLGFFLVISANKSKDKVV